MVERLELSDKVFKGILLSLLKGYTYSHKGELPKVIVVPKIVEVGGVPVEYPKEAKEDDKSRG